jgi:hypothetical protein
MTEAGSVWVRVTVAPGISMMLVMVSAARVDVTVTGSPLTVETIVVTTPGRVSVTVVAVGGRVIVTTPPVTVVMTPGAVVTTPGAVVTEVTVSAGSVEVTVVGTPLTVVTIVVTSPGMVDVTVTGVPGAVLTSVTVTGGSVETIVVGVPAIVVSTVVTAPARVVVTIWPEAVTVVTTGAAVLAETGQLYRYGCSRDLHAVTVTTWPEQPEMSCMTLLSWRATDVPDRIRPLTTDPGMIVTEVAASAIPWNEAPMAPDPTVNASPTAQKTS